MGFIPIAEFPADTDLTPVSRALANTGIAHDIVVEGSVAVLYVDEQARREDVEAAVRAAIRGNALQRQGARTPVVMALLALSILGAAVAEWGFGLVRWLTFQDFILVSPREVEFATLADTLANGQYWRLITPIFLHFGIFHIAFNGLWLWEFGRRIEVHVGGAHLLILVLVAGLVSNYSQYLWSGPSLFGGMSGVLYALLGYLWIRNRVAPQPGLALPPGIVGFMLAWLLICMTGVIDLLFQGSVANAAHASGLIAGMALGLVFGLANRRAVR